ncbi:MAG: restriction endonuclease subunit S [Lachnospiraceae bacterium]
MGKPKIRFRGYTEDWEQRKLGEVAQYRRGSFPQPYGKSEWYDGENAMPFVQVADVTDNMKLVSDTKQKISEHAQPMSVFAEKGSVLVTLQGSIGRVAITQYGAFVDRTVLIFEDYKTEIDNAFWAYIVKQKFIEEAKKAPGGIIKTITKEVLSDFDMMLPSYDEQVRLGVYFQSLDHLITLHQRKCEETKKLKKYMLQKMFPKNGQKIPEIRFSGFTEDWEQRKLGEVAQYRRGSFPQPYGKSEWYDGENAMPFVQVADVTDNMKLVSDTKQKISEHAQPMSVFAEKGSVLVTLQGSIGRVAITQYGAFVDRTVLIFEDYKTEIDNAFWAYIVKQKFIEEAKKAPGGIIKTITKEVLSDFDMMLPSYDEQVRLGVYFQSLDHLITLHQRKCDELQNIKKYMLQNMFV